MHYRVTRRTYSWIKCIKELLEEFVVVHLWHTFCHGSNSGVLANSFAARNNDFLHVLALPFVLVDRVDVCGWV